jgi:transposase
MALEYAQLPDSPEELKQLLLKHSNLVEALRAEVIRLRRWRFGRSAEVLDPSIAPELPLAGGESSTVASPPIADTTRPPKLLAVETRTPKLGQRRPARLLPPELPRVIRIHAPSRCTCPDCGRHLTRLGEDASEQLDYVPGYFQVIRHVRPKLSCGACARIVQAPAPSRPIERGLPSAALLAQVAAAKYADHLLC